MVAYLKIVYHRYLSDPNASAFIFALLALVAGIWSLGGIMAPLIVAGIVSYLLNDVSVYVEKRGVPRIAAVALVCLGTLTLFVFALFGLIPLLVDQARQLIRELPEFVAHTKEILEQLPARYPVLFNEKQVAELLAELQRGTANLSQQLLGSTVAAIPKTLTLAVYAVLIPLLVFFFLKDRETVLDWIRRLGPRDDGMALHIWREVDVQIGNYIRGKTWEIGIVWAVSYVSFLWLDLRYSILLSLLVGLSVLIPYVGATFMTFPVAAVAYSQWGISSDLTWTVLTYLIVQALDGNVLVPILFSEIVDLHPIVIIAAVLFFGGIWGITGVFFAIPLATLIRAIFRNWPVHPYPVPAEDETVS